MEKLLMASYFDLRPQIASGVFGLVDLRSPSEFRDGAMPGAVNIPLFSDDERATVGTIYKQVGAHDAVAKGLELIAAKMNHFCDQVLSFAQGHEVIAVHCWRGGMRSQAVAKLLGALNVPVMIIDGGYKNYRRQVLAQLDFLARHRLLVLNGRTGVGKTNVIRVLKSEGLPAIDLEHIARHRGSALGAFNQDFGQPTQQNFENELANAFDDCKGRPVILIELEQNIGSIQLAVALREALHSSDMILLRRSMRDRIQIIKNDYVRQWNEDHDRIFIEQMTYLKKHLQGPIYKKIIEDVLQRDFDAAIENLLHYRYDRCYDKVIARHSNQIKLDLDLTNDETASFDAIRKMLSFS